MPTLAIPSAEERAARQMAMLRELAEIGMELARALGAQALAELSPEANPDTPKAATGDPVAMFTRVARAVRQTVALEMRIGRADTQDQAEDDRALARYEMISRRAVVQEIASDAVKQTVEDDFERERLLDEIDRRLDIMGPEDASYAYQPVNVMVAQICRQLGVRPDWSLWAAKGRSANEDGDRPHPGMWRPPAEPDPHPDTSP